VKKQIKVNIIENIQISGKYFRLSFDSPWIAKTAKPGQFMQIKISDDITPFLRKPFGVHRIIGQNTVGVLYGVVGEGTQILSRRKNGEALDVIGPLGNGFSCQLSARLTGVGGQAISHQLPILVAGGIGVAPLLYLAQRLTAHSPQHRAQSSGPKAQSPIVLIGTKTKAEVLCEKEFRALGCEVKIATDDDSRGYRGFVTGLLNNILNTQYSIHNTIYACGPKPMLKEVANIANLYRIPCQVLMEEYMACGIGACLGCAVKVHKCISAKVHEYEYKMVCKDGPVFDANDILWE
jgi:dihydroorotate dehydrogenase electron transfer subunit